VYYTVNCAYWIVVCPLLLYLFDFIQKERIFPYFSLLYTQCLILCMCLSVLERKVLLLCSVMSAVPVPSKNSLENLDDFRYNGLLGGLQNWTSAGPTTQCMCRTVFQTWINWARYSSFLPKSVD